MGVQRGTPTAKPFQNDGKLFELLQIEGVAGGLRAARPRESDTVAGRSASIQHRGIGTRLEERDFSMRKAGTQESRKRIKIKGRGSGQAERNDTYPKTRRRLVCA